MSSLQQYLDLYRDHRSLVEGSSHALLNGPRAAAAAFLAQTAFPTNRTERYKYTNADAAFAPDYGLNLNRHLAVADPYKTYHCAVAGITPHVMYVVNDVVVPMRGAEKLPEGLRVMSLNEAAAVCPELLEKYYHRAAAQEPANAHKHQDLTERDAVTQLNTLLAQDGVLVHLAEGVRLETAIQIVFVSSTGQERLMSNRRLLVVAEADAEAHILLCEHADKGHEFLTTQVTEVYAAPRAAVNLYTIEETQSQNTRFSNVYIEQEAESRVSHNGIALTTGLSRTMINARLLGTGADCQTTGAVIADGKQRVENNLLVDHAAEACTSDMLYKYVLDQESQATFAGKVLVRPGAQKTLSHQSNANLCLSPEAHANSLPMLEIYADDVRCNHGSTIGKLDEAALFYLRQRGLPESEARLLLQHAFINDVLQRVPIDALRERLSHLVEMRFRGEERRCQGCRLC